EALRQQAAEARAALDAARAEIERLKSAQAQASVAAAPAPAPAAPAAGAQSSANALNPAISVILDGVYAHHSLDPDHHRRAGFPGGGATHGGVGAKTFFVHAGGDVGVESSWLAGFSVLDTDVSHGEDGFDGSEKLYLADLTWKWAPGGNTKDGGVTLRGEYFHE